MDLSLLSCRCLSGVGERIAKHLACLAIYSVQDLLFHLPLRYQDRTRISSIANVVPGDHVMIEGDLVAVTAPRGGRTQILCRLSDQTGQIHLRFFHIHAQQRRHLQPGVRLRCFGEMRRGTYGAEMIHPEYRILSLQAPQPVEQALTPIYPATEGLSQFHLRRLTQQALDRLANGGMLNDLLPSTLLKKFTFPTLKDALFFVHRPPPDAPLDLLMSGKHASQRRLVFEELLAHCLGLLRLKKEYQTQKATSFCKRNTLLATQFLQQLPFSLTAAQKKVMKEIDDDLARPYPMLRLLQGDVGSGKTVVAAFAMLQAVDHGCQVAMLAPTELLAEQHYHTFQAWFDPLGIQVVMLLGQMKAAERRTGLSAIETGSAHVVIGTHALFQKDVAFSQLALVVVDEQHRFGVQQRALLREKGVRGTDVPHQLIMTATPIPRTLAMSVYADLDCSVMDELPPGGISVTTSVISNTRRHEVSERIRHACATGRQAYWVCTLIEESDVLQCQAAEKTAQSLRVALPELNVALIHGRMKSVEKEQIMLAFKQKEIHLLVATTVIEVGVDVSNASLMVVENAERLGLAQLHQLRGRVGRGAMSSHCVLLYQFPLSADAKKRLSVMRETTDGFKIAECDLALRGPGEVLGTKQTGDISLRIADLVRDSDLLPAVQKTADVLLKDYPDMINPLIQRWLGTNGRYGHI